MDVAIVILYIAVLIGFGLRGGRGIKNAADFTAANRRCGTFVMFASLSASFIGGGYSSGNAAAAFENGIGTALSLCGFGIGMILVGKWLVPGVWRFEHAKTVGDIIGTSYGETARRLTGIFAFLCGIGVVAAQMETIGLVFHTLLGITPTVGALLGCFIVLIYTTFGGLGSVILADMVQFLLLAVGMPLLLLLGIRECGGFAPFFEALPPALLSPVNNSSWPSFLALFVSLMCGEALAPPYMQRLLIGKNPRSTARGTVFSGLFSLPFFLVTAGIGLTARVLHVTDTPTLAMPQLILAILPTGIRGLLMAAMVSIILSAADGFLNSSTISLVCDAILPYRPHLSDRSELRLLRSVNLLCGIAAVLLSLCVPNVFAILLLAYSFWSPVVLVPLAAALRGIHASERTFIVSAAVGFTVCLLWNIILARPFDIDGCVVGTLANLLTFTLCRTRIIVCFLKRKSGTTT